MQRALSIERQIERSRRISRDLLDGQGRLAERVAVMEMPMRQHLDHDRRLVAVEDADLKVLVPSSLGALVEHARFTLDVGHDDLAEGIAVARESCGIEQSKMQSVGRLVLRLRKETRRSKDLPDDPARTRRPSSSANADAVPIRVISYLDVSESFLASVSWSS